MADVNISVGQTLTYSKSFNAVGGYAGYKIRQTITLNSQDTNNGTSNITIKRYIAANGATYSGYTSPKVYTDLGVNTSTYTNKNSSTVSSVTSTSYKQVGSWTGDVQHNASGECYIHVRMRFRHNMTSPDSYLPANTSLESNNGDKIILPITHRPPEITVNSVTERNQVLINAGVPNDKYVFYLSQKRFNITGTIYDSATPTRYWLENGQNTIGEISSTNTNVNIDVDFENVQPVLTKVLDNYYFDISPFIIDSKGSKNVTSSFVQQPNNYIAYFHPNLSGATLIKKRVTPVTSDVVQISVNGSYYNKTTIGTIPNAVTIKYKYWRVGETEPSAWITIPSSAITITTNALSISNYQIGNDLDYRYSYTLKLSIEDTFTTTPQIISSTIPTGEPLWAEYKDRVDFKKLTINGVEVTPGGGGTSDYNALSNKPQINSVSLSGNKSSSDLGLQSEITNNNKLAYSLISGTPHIPINSDFTLNGLSEKSYNNLTDKPTIPSGALANLNSIDYTSNYLTNKPTIPTALSQLSADATHRLVTDTEKTTWNNKANTSDIPTKTSELTNDSGFIDNTYHDDTKQDKLIGTQTTGQNIKTINGTTLLGSGNITIGGGGTSTDVQINGTSITSGGVANIVTESAYDSSTNKIATMSDIPSETVLYHNDTGSSTSVALSENATNFHDLTICFRNDNNGEFGSINVHEPTTGSSKRLSICCLRLSSNGLAGATARATINGTTITLDGNRGINGAFSTIGSTYKVYITSVIGRNRK